MTWQNSILERISDLGKPQRSGLPGTLRRWNASLHVVCLACGMFLLAGCQEGGVPAAVEPAAAEPASAMPTDEELVKTLDEVLESTFAHRHLNLRQHAAWQILHGALAYQRQFLVENLGGERVSAVDYLLDGGTMKGWILEPIVDSESGHRGLRAILEVGTKTGQGHSDQWFAILAQCGLEPEQPIRVGDEQFKIADLVAQVQLDVPRNVQQEYSWTLIGLTTYLPTDAQWLASDGSEWSIERLLEIETRQCQTGRGEAACGGTHRLIGIAMALNRHLDGGGELEGVWSEANEQVQRAIQDARRYQNPNGSFSSRYLEGPGISPDLAQSLGTTGHVLEFLTLAMSDEQLAQPWVKRAAVNLCELFEKTKDVPLECGALYHAAHGLALYRERLAAMSFQGPSISS